MAGYVYVAELNGHVVAASSTKYGLKNHIDTHYGVTPSNMRVIRVREGDRYATAYGQVVVDITEQMQ